MAIFASAMMRPALVRCAWYSAMMTVGTWPASARQRVSGAMNMRLGAVIAPKQIAGHANRAWGSPEGSLQNQEKSRAPSGFASPARRPVVDSSG